MVFEKRVEEEVLRSIVQCHEKQLEQASFSFSRKKESLLSVLQNCYDWVQPYTQASSRYPSDQRRLKAERDSAMRPRRIFPTGLTGDVTSEIAEDDWERQQMLCLLKLFDRGFNEIMSKVYRTTVPNVSEVTDSYQQINMAWDLQTTNCDFGLPKVPTIPIWEQIHYLGCALLKGKPSLVVEFRIPCS